MCKLVCIESSGEALALACGLCASEWDDDAAIDAGPGGYVPVVLNEAPDRLTSARWGLVPATARTAGFGNQLVNARSDGLLDRPSYRAAFLFRRCLIVIDAFYERCRMPDGRRGLMRFELASGGPMALAGIWDTWETPDGDLLRTCTMVTVPANRFVGRVHGRMPCVLPPDRQRQWLECSDPGECIAMLQPCAEDVLACRFVAQAGA